MGLTAAIADVIDILRGRPACGGDGPDDWERMVAIIAENDSLPQQRGRAHREGYRRGDEGGVAS
jgi:predicted secreted protein